MIALYYIGGPSDLTKQMLPLFPDHALYALETRRMTLPQPEDSRFDRSLKLDFVRHRYLTRQIGQELFVAIYDGPVE